VQQIDLDVSDLPAPEPFDRIMQALVNLATDQYLRVAHRKQPLLLFKPLQDNGYTFHVQKGQTQAFDIYIWHTQSPAPKDLITPSIVDTNNPPEQCSN